MRRDKYGYTDVEDSDDFDGLQPEDGGEPLNFNDRDRDEELYDDEEEDLEDLEDSEWYEDEYEDEENYEDDSELDEMDL